MINTWLMFTAFPTATSVLRFSSLQIGESTRSFSGVFAYRAREHVPILVRKQELLSKTE